MSNWSSRKNKKKSSSVIASVKDAYHCVEVKASILDECEVVKNIRGIRFLSVEAPTLPLKGCDKNCKCRFVHHKDRRVSDRRSRFLNSSGPIDVSESDKNRRLGGDRRKT